MVECDSNTVKAKKESNEVNPSARERKRPDYYGDYTYCLGDDMTNIDYCYKLVCNVPQTYTEAVTSVNANEWVNAMDEEMQSLQDNATFILTPLPVGKDVVGGGWV